MRSIHSPLSVFIILLATWIICTGALANATVRMDIPDTVEIGDQFTVQGIIDQSVPVLFPDELILMIRAPMDSQAEGFTTLIPKTDRTFEKTITADITGEWKISARYGDITTAPVEVKVVPRKTRMKTTLDLYPYGAPVGIRGTVTMSGVLRGADGNGLANRAIVYEVGLPSYTWYGLDGMDESERIWKQYGTATTEATGRYAFSFPVYDTGSFGVRTSFAGDEVYRASRSNTESVRVN